MEGIIEEITKGILRVIGYIFIEFLFNFVFYYIGWPICKILTFGKYPKSVDYDYLHTERRDGYMCSFVGCAAVLIGLTIWFWK